MISIYFDRDIYIYIYRYQSCMRTHMYTRVRMHQRKRAHARTCTNVNASGNMHMHSHDYIIYIIYNTYIYERIQFAKYMRCACAAAAFLICMRMRKPISTLISIARSSSTIEGTYTSVLVRMYACMQLTLHVHWHMRMRMLNIIL